MTAGSAVAAFAQHDGALDDRGVPAVRRATRRLRHSRRGRGALVLEELEHAKARGAHIYAELLGGASTADAYHITAPAPGGAGAVGCMELALEDAGITAAEVAHVNAHGTSTPLNDLAEAEAIDKIFGPPGTAGDVDQRA